MTSQEPRQAALEREAAAAKGPYGDAAVEAGDPSRLRFLLTGDTDPQLPARVLALLTVRAELPLQFSFSRRDADDSVELRFELLANEVAIPELLLDRLLKLPTVRDARLLPATWEA